MFDVSRMQKSVFIIAEISANHGGSFNRAVDLIEQAKFAGADAVKFQAYIAESMAVNVKNRYFKIANPNWRGQTLYQLYKKIHTPRNWFKELKKIADSLGIVFFATAFDKENVDFLETLDVPLHKVSSFEIGDLSLIEYMAKTQKPIMLSTGMATKVEIQEAVNTAKEAGAKDIILLKCVSSYPAIAEDMNLKTIPNMAKIFNCPIGLSDHTLGIEASIAAVSLGACVLEKHFTLSKNKKTPDSFFSIDPKGFRDLVKTTRIVKEALGKVKYGIVGGEKKTKTFRRKRSLFAIKDIKKGDVFNEINVKSVRSFYGISPKDWKKVRGYRANKDIKKGNPLRAEFIDG